MLYRPWQAGQTPPQSVSSSSWFLIPSRQVAERKKTKLIKFALYKKKSNDYLQNHIFDYYFLPSSEHNISLVCSPGHFAPPNLGSGSLQNLCSITLLFGSSAQRSEDKLNQLPHSPWTMNLEIINYYKVRLKSISWKSRSFIYDFSTNLVFFLVSCNMIH